LRPLCLCLREILEKMSWLPPLRDAASPHSEANSPPPPAMSQPHFLPSSSSTCCARRRTETSTEAVFIPSLAPLDALSCSFGFGFPSSFSRPQSFVASSSPPPLAIQPDLDLSSTTRTSPLHLYTGPACHAAL
jgi:hypothetical protein